MALSRLFRASKIMPGVPGPVFIHTFYVCFMFVLCCSSDDHVCFWDDYGMFLG